MYQFSPYPADSLIGARFRHNDHIVPGKSISEVAFIFKRTTFLHPMKRTLNWLEVLNLFVVEEVCNTKVQKHFSSSV
jgi:hypothetical protein